MAEGGIFVKILASFEAATFLTAIEQLRKSATTAGKEVGKSWDSAAAISKKAGDEVIKTGAAVQAATEKRITTEKSLEIATARRGDAEKSVADTNLAQIREVEAAELNLDKVRAGLRTERIAELEAESRKAAIFAEVEIDATRKAEAEKTALTKAGIAERMKLEDEYREKSAVNRLTTAVNATPSDTPVLAAVAAEDNARRNAAKSLDAQNAAIKANADAVDVAAATQVTASQKAAAAITAAGKGSAIALVTLGGVSAHVASQVEQNMNRLVVMHQEGTASVTKMSQQVYELANQVPFSVQKLSEGLQLIEQHGYRGQDAMNVLTASAKTALSTNAELGDTIGGLTTQLDDMGYQGEKGPQLLKDMNTMAGQLVVTMKDLKNLNPGEYFRALHSVEPSASAYMSGMPGNVRSAQISAMMDTLSQTGMTQEQSAPNLARMISVLGAVRPGSSTFNALGQLGLKQADIAGEMRTQGPIDVIKTIQDKINERTLKDGPNKGLVDMGWQYNNAQVDDLIAESKKGLSAGGQDFVKNHPEIEKGLGKQNVLKKLLGETSLSGPESGDILTLAQWEAMKNSPQSFIKKGGTADLTPGQVYQQLFGTGDVARTGLILGQNPDATKQRADDVRKQGENPNTLQEAFDQAMKTTTNQWKLLGTTAGSLAGRIGNDLLPKIKAVIDGFTTMIDFIGRHKTASDLLVKAMLTLAGFYAGTKIIGAIKAVVDAFGTLKGWLTASEVKDGLTNLSTGSTAAGTTLKTSSVATGAELKAGAAALSAEERAAGLALETDSKAAGAELEAGAGAAATQMKLGVGSLLARAAGPIGAALMFGPDIRKGLGDNIPGVNFIQNLPTPDNLLFSVDAWLQGKQDNPLPGDMGKTAQDKLNAELDRRKAAIDAAGGPTTPQSVADKTQSIMDSVNSTITAAKAGMPGNQPDDAPDHSGDTGSGDSTSGSGGATAPDIASQAKFHPIDLNPADTPAGDTYDEWITKQKAVQSALNEVDNSATAMAAAQSKLTELTKKGTATQSELNSANDALVKAKVDNQDAVQNATIAENKLAEPGKGKNSKNSWDDYNPFSENGSGGFTLPNIAKLLGTWAANEALGNPYGKLQAAKLGESATNPMWVQDVNGAISSNALASSGIVQNSDGSYSTKEGSGTFSGGPNVPAGSGAEGWRKTVAETVAKYGPAAGISPQNYGKWTDAIVSQIGIESQGFAGADNAHDSNGRGGTQHVSGLLQYLPSTFANSAEKLTGVTNMMDPVAQIAGALMAPRTAEGLPAGLGKGGGWGPNLDTPINPAAVAPDAPAAAPAAAPGATAQTTILQDLLKQFLPGAGPGSDGPVLKRSPPPPAPTGPLTPSDVHYVPGFGFMNGKGESVDSFGRRSSPTKLDEATLRGGDMKDWQYSHPGGAPNAPAPNGPGGAPAPGGPGTDLFKPGAVLGGSPGQIGPYAPGSLGGGPGAQAARRGNQGAPGLAGPSNAPIQQQQFGTAAAQQGVSGGGGAGPSPGSLIGMAEQALSAAAGPLAPVAGIAMQEQNRLVGYLGQLAGIGAEGLLETFSLSGQNFDPSSTLVGKVVSGLAGAKGSGGPNAAGKTAPPLNKDDNKKDPNQQQKDGDGQNPGVNIGTQNFYGDSKTQADAATKSINTASMMYGGQRPS